MIEKKEEVFKTGIINKFEIPDEILKTLDSNLLIKNKEYAFNYMFMKENENVLQMKRTYAHYNHNLLMEFNRVRKLNGEKHKSQFIRVSEKHTDILTDVSFHIYYY